MTGTAILQTRQLAVIWGAGNPTGNDRDAGENETLDRSPSAPYAYSNPACWGIDVRLSFRSQRCGSFGDGQAFRHFWCRGPQKKGVWSTDIPAALADNSKYTDLYRRKTSVLGNCIFPDF